MKIYALIVTLLGLLSQTSLAQVGIGTTTPHASTKLQIDATDKGFLPPRVALTSTTDVTTIASPVVGLMVYCTGTAGLGAGYCFWNGTEWSSMNNVANPLDLGYVLAWTSNTTAPNHMLPLSGGTYNWADYPDFQTFNVSYPSQFIASSTATTFTLKNINSAGRFLRGGTSAGVEQAQSTAMPITPFTLAAAGAHAHSVDPPNTSTTTDGNHQHNMWFHNDDWNGSGGGNQSLEDDGGAWYTRPTDWAGAHAHTVDIGAFNSSTAADHNHTITGGDAETRPANISVVWYLKVKPTGTAGNLTIVNQSGAVSNANNGLTVSGSNVQLGGALVQSTTIAQAGYDLGFTNGEVGIGTATPANKLEVNSGASAQSGVRLTQLTNANQLGTNANGDIIPIVRRVSQAVEAGIPVVLDNVRVQLATSGNRSLQIAATSGSFVMDGMDEALYSASSYTNNSFGARTVNTTMAYITPGWSLGSVGNVQRTTFHDTTNGRGYIITLVIGNGYITNYITIERL
jgi:hypothetical protein